MPLFMREALLSNRAYDEGVLIYARDEIPRALHGNLLHALQLFKVDSADWISYATAKMHCRVAAILEMDLNNVDSMILWLCHRACVQSVVENFFMDVQPTL